MSGQRELHRQPVEPNAIPTRPAAARSSRAAATAVTGFEAAKAIRGARHRDTNMRKSDNTILQHYGDYITSALQTEGGHLSIGRGGFTLHFGRGARLFPAVSVTRFDAAHIHDHLDAAIRPSVVLMNPPFSAAAHVDGRVAEPPLSMAG